MNKRFYSDASTIQFLCVALLGAALLLVSYATAPGIAEQQKTFGSLEGNVLHRQTILSIAVSMAFMIAAFCLFVLQRRQGPSTLWRSVWTVSFLAFVVHLYWAVRLMNQQSDWTLVSSPVLDSVLFLWWLVDVVVAWIPGTPGSSINGLGDRPPVTMLRSTLVKDLPPYPGAWFVRLQRSTLHLAMFFAMVIASIPQGQGIIKALGIVMILAVAASIAIRIVIRPFHAESLSALLYQKGFALLNRFFAWHELPTVMAVTNLGAIRETLRAKNLYGTESIPVTNPKGLIDGGNVPLPNPTDLTERRSDGCFNDLAKPSMGRGSVSTHPSEDPMLHDKSHPCARFGRNVPLKHAFPDIENLMHPNPRLISNALLAREEFKPAKILNLIAAAWIQFQTHDWFNHGEPVTQCPFKVPPVNGDDWPGEMEVKQTRPDPTRDYAKERNESPTGNLIYPPTYVNAESHWWDASQIYGATPQQAMKLRSSPSSKSKMLPGGKLYLADDDSLPIDPSDPRGLALSGFVGNWWLGLSLLHNVFVREHNAICDKLAASYPEWNGDRIYATARMVNAALMAKIHTVEWTTAILQNPALQVGMNANWWGLATEGFTKTFGRISPTEAFSGIPNSGVDHHGVDFTLTEEFVSVYRLHPLMPDEFKLYRHGDGRLLQKFDFPEGMLGAERDLIRNGHPLVKTEFTPTDLWYSFGRAYPGAVTLHNYPNYLRKFTRESLENVGAEGSTPTTQETIDLATIEIIRDRERGVPRYNQFRRLFHLPPINSFDDLDQAQPGTAEKLRAIYGQKNGVDNVELLDLMVGMYAEVPPAGFGFSDTAFRVFILMASRRLKSDRFIAQGYNANVFTSEGIQWIEDNSMLTILHRHFPELAPALYGVKNAFVPWVDVNKHGVM